jgi:hypothetical protein
MALDCVGRDARPEKGLRRSGSYGGGEGTRQQPCDKFFPLYRQKELVLNDVTEISAAQGNRDLIMVGASVLGKLTAETTKGLVEKVRARQQVEEYFAGLCSEDVASSKQGFRQEYRARRKRKERDREGR